MSIASSWYGDLEKRVSLGKVTDKATSLAGLHVARATHYGQFWTPTSISRYIWKLLKPSFDAAIAAKHGRIALLDNSIGSGRLVQFADPENFTISGSDIDEQTVTALNASLAAAGFVFEVFPNPMEVMRFQNYSAAIINPAFSVHLEAPLLENFPSNSFGRFGPGTSALSHAYALEQALMAADVVAAILPSSFADTVHTQPFWQSRLAARIDLASDAFLAEGANVSTSILVFDSMDRATPPIRIRAPSTDIDPPSIHLTLRLDRHLKPCAKSARLDTSLPTIKTPLTGDRSVRVYRSGRTIRLGFKDGLTEAKVLNAIHREKIRYSPLHRYPRGVVTTGQGQLDLEILLTQDDPLAALHGVLKLISDQGASVQVDAQLMHYFAKRIRTLAIQKTPLRLSTLVPAGEELPTSENLLNGQIIGRCKKKHLVNPTRWGSKLVKAGDQISVEVSTCNNQTLYRYGADNDVAELTRPQFAELFSVGTSTADVDTWVQRFEGRAAAFPNKAMALTAQARAQGLDQICSWGYQFQDLIEMSMTPGSIGAHMMGLGKSRLAIALALLGGGRRNLIVVEAQALPEFEAQLEALDLPAGTWKTIASRHDLTDLPRIGLISYTRLRLPLHRSSPKRTFAKMLRGRIHTVIADEAHAISNETTDQVRALYQVNPTRKLGFTGTPIGNLPRSLFPLLAWVSGDGTAAQPFGRRYPYIEPRLLKSMDHAMRGQDALIEKHVTVEWVTAQFAEDFSGGKREIPSLRNLDEYRDYISRFVLRRVWKEPEVAKYVSVPDPVQEVIELPWNDRHLAAYLTTAQEFAHWWKSLRDSDSQRGLNMVAILQRLAAVFRAANFPHELEGPASYSGPSTKHDRIIDDLVRNHQNGKKTILFAQSPKYLASVGRQLAELGIKSVSYTGLQPIRARTRQLNEQYRFGDASILLMSFGVGQTALNLPIANEVMFAHRLWTSRQEQQAMFRAIRPQQKQVVRVRYYQLQGSIDCYMQQMVAHKADCQTAGLDWGTPQYQPSDFKHWLSILESFVQDIAKLRGCNRFDLTKLLHAQKIHSTPVDSMMAAIEEPS